MTGKIKYVKGAVLASALGLVLAVGSVTAPAMPQPQGDGDTTRGEVKKFDHYLDSHPEVAEQLRKNPSLVNREDYMEKHPELREWMKNHPAARQQLKENPRAFMKREHRFENHERPEMQPRPNATVNKRR